MQTGNIFGLVASLLVVQLAAVSAQTAGNDTSNGNGTIRVVLAVPAGNATLNLGSGTSTTAVPTTTVTSGSAGASGKNSTGSGKLGEEDCSDEDGTPEPEGAATNGTERSGKQLTLNDHEKYSHDGAAAEPEPESEPSGNSTSSAGNELEIGENNKKYIDLEFKI